MKWEAAEVLRICI